MEFDQYTAADEASAGRTLSRAGHDGYVVSSAHPRLVDGKPSKNPRYLQQRPDLVDPRESYLAEMCARLDREIPGDQPVHFPVNAVLAGRRNNPADPKLGLAAAGGLQPDPLPGTARAVHGLHLQPDGQVAVHDRLRQRRRADEGAVQRGLAGGRSEQRAGVVDPDGVRGLHHGGRLRRAALPGGSRHQHAGAGDLVPHAGAGARSGVPDRATDTWRSWTTSSTTGGRVLASRLGYRITSLFADRFLGRIFETPDAVFPEEMLRPEKQDLGGVRQRAWMPSWMRRGAWLRTTSRTAAWRRPARR